MNRFKCKLYLLLDYHSMNLSSKHESDAFLKRENIWLFIVLLWTFFIITSLFFNLKNADSHLKELAYVNAKTFYERDMAYRQWVIFHWGVYVPVSEKTPSNPYLRHPFRDIETTDGKKLTLINAAYMSRQVYEWQKENKFASNGRAISLKPLRPENQPDEWERKALASLERGALEQMDIQRKDGHTEARFIRPFHVEKSCLKCHSDQKYNLGDVMGGLSVSVPMDQVNKIASQWPHTLIIIHLVFWGVGLCGILWTASKEAKIYRDLRESEERFRTLADHTIDWELWIGPSGKIIYMSPSCEVITGYPREAFLNNSDLMTQIIHHDDAECIARHTHDQSSSEPANIDFRIIRRDGSTRWINHVCKPIYNERGEYIGRRATNRDITEQRIAEDSLKKRDGEMRKIIEASPMPVYFYRLEPDDSLVLSGGNSACKHIHGITPQEMIGQPIENIFPSILESSHSALCRKIARGEIGPMQVEMSHLGSSASSHYDVSIFQVTPFNIAVQFFNITERKAIEDALRESEERWKFAIEGSGVGVWDWNIVTGELLVSKKWKDMLGFGEDEIQFDQEEWRKRVHPDDLARSMRDLQAHFDGLTEVYVNEHRILMKNGSFKWILARGMVLKRDPDGIPLRMVGTHTDINDRKILEAEAEKHTTEVLTHNYELDAFARTVAHDLKAPSSTLATYADYMIESYEKMGAKDIRDSLIAISQTARKMNSIIKEILLLAGVEHQQPYFEQVDMGFVVGECIHRLERLSSKSTAKIKLPQKWPTIISYAPWIEEIWVNYISNAIKYGGSSTVIELGWDMENDGEFVRFWIKDNGDGISIDDQKKLFSTFVRLHKINIKGHGLGLSIVKKIAEKLGGYVGVKSELGKGSVFSFSLPAKLVSSGKSV